MNSVYSAQNVRSYNGKMMDEGKAAESIVLRWLYDHPSIIGVEDTRELRVLMEADVDCVIQTIDGRVMLAEIKSDQHIKETGNVVFEAIRINHTCQPDRAVTLAWTARSPAKWLFIYNQTTKKLFQCEFDDLRRSFQLYTQTQRKNTRSVYIETDSIKSTFIFLIPFANCVSSVGKSIFKIYDLSAFEIAA